jgi:hypothetical protein
VQAPPPVVSAAAPSGSMPTSPGRARPPRSPASRPHDIFKP